MPLITASIIAGGATLAGGYMAGQGAEKAGKASAKATDRATDLQREMWQQQRSDFAPWLNAGMVGLDQLQEMLRPGYDITQTPGYQFRYNQGLDSIRNILSAKGMRDSGAALKAAAEYGQNYATGEYNNEWNRMVQLAGMGSGPVQMQGQLGGQYATNMGNLLMSGGANQANAIQNQYSGYGNTLTNMGDIYANQMMLNNLLNRTQPGSSPTSFMTQPQNSLIVFPS